MPPDKYVLQVNAYYHARTVLMIAVETVSLCKPTEQTVETVASSAKLARYVPAVNVC